MISIFLVIASVAIHYEFLWRINCFLPRLRFWPPRTSVPIAVIGAFVSHFCHITLFACVYYLMQRNAGVTLGGETGIPSFNTILYFSTETYTSLGFGDLYPLPLVRMIVGVESITGLLMISWTASFTFFEMNRFWSSQGHSIDPPAKK